MKSHVGAHLRNSNMAAGQQWKRLEFTLALSHRLLSLLNLKLVSGRHVERSPYANALKFNIRIGTSLNILVTQNSKT